MTTTTDVKEKSYDSNHDTTTRSTKHRQSYLYVLILTVTTIALSFQVERSYIQGINAARQASKQEAGNCGNANRTGLSISFEDDKKSKSLNHTRSPPNLTDELLDRFIVIPEYKMVFCYSEKVGCTMFNKIFTTVATPRKNPGRLAPQRMSPNSGTLTCVMVSGPRG